MSKGAPNATNATRTSSAPTSEIEAFTDGTPAWFIDISARSFKDANQVSEPKGFVAAGCFKAEAKSFDVNKFEVTLDVTDPGFYPFPNHESEKCAGGKTEGDKTHDKYAALRDTSMPELGLRDMVDLKYLNDGELNENLYRRFLQDKCYCYCGTTCTALNLNWRWKGYPKVLSKALSKSKEAWREAYAKWEAEGGLAAWKADPANTIDGVLQKLEGNCPHNGGFAGFTTKLSNTTHTWGGQADGVSIPGHEPEDTFAEDVMRSYVGCDQEDPSLQPHLYAIIDNSFQGMFTTQLGSRGPCNQAVLITGESGAGKTYNTKKALAFIDMINEVKTIELTGSRPEGDGMTKKIKMTMPIMDAFGNAAMPRNDDSSRFGKLIKIFFSGDQVCTGASITPYLLEKSRVCSQQSWERNFHSFYFMLTAAQCSLDGDGNLIQQNDPAIFNTTGLHLKQKHEYRILNTLYDELPGAGAGEPLIFQGDDYSKAAVCQFLVCNKFEFETDNGKVSVKSSAKDELECFMDLKESLDFHSFSPQIQEQLWKIMSALLLLGNVTFHEVRNKQAIVNQEPLLQACELLQIDPVTLEDSLLHKYMPGYGGKETMLAFTQPRKGLDALVRTIYNDVFVELIQQFSFRLAPPNPRDKWLGILDIFGFEFYDQSSLVASEELGAKVVNSFEQFCINLTNEKLQEHYVKCVFKGEIAQFSNEGLQVSSKDFDFVPNTKTVSMLEGNNGILGILDESVKNPANLKSNGAGEKYLLKSFKNKVGDAKHWGGPNDEETNFKTIENHFSMTTNRDKYEGARGTGGFKVEHYAATVIYDVEGWCEKNFDKVEKKQYEIVMTSTLMTVDYAAKPATWPDGASWPPPGERPLLDGFKELRNPDAEPKDSHGRACKSTLGAQFKASLASLLDELKGGDAGTTKCAFVRCLKPNSAKIPTLYEPGLILNQLQYTGMLDSLRIRKDGWPSRREFQDFYYQYKPLHPDCGMHGDTPDGWKQAAVGIVNKLKTTTDWNIQDIESAKQLPQEQMKNIQIFIGKTRILMKDDISRALESDRETLMVQYSLTVQSCYRAKANRDKYRAYKGAIYKLLPELHAFTGRAITFEAQDSTELAAEEASIKEYYVKKKVEEEAEHEERVLKQEWDEYQYRVLDGTRLEMFRIEKQGDLDGAKSHHEKAIKLYQDTTAAFEQNMADLQALDSAANSESIDADTATRIFTDAGVKSSMIAPAVDLRNGPKCQLVKIGGDDYTPPAAAPGGLKTRAKFRISFRKTRA